MIDCTQPLNTSHWAASGLVGMWYPLVPSGAIFQNLCYQPDSLIAGQGLAPRSPIGNSLNCQESTFGPSQNTSISGPGWRLVAPSARLLIPTNLTLIWRGVVYGSGAGDNPRVFGMLANNTNTSPYDGYGFFRATAGLSYSYNNGASYLPVSLVSAPTANVVYELALTISPTAVKGYVNGVATTSGSGVTAIAYGATAEIVMGPYNGSTGNSNAATSLAMVYNKALDSATIAAIYKLNSRKSNELIRYIKRPWSTGVAAIISSLLLKRRRMLM